ncbi:MAG: DUF167 domain-containing protein [Syntrophaceae bacterium]
MLRIRETEKGAVLEIRVLPRSSRCEIAGLQDGALKIKITAPPVEGKANKECIRFISDLLNVKKSAVSIIAGEKSKNKTILISGIKAKDVEKAINALASGPLPLWGDEIQ